MSAPLEAGYGCGADPEALFGLLSSPAWAADRAEHLGDGSRVERRDVRVDGSVRIEVSRELPEGVPGPLQRFLPPDGRVLQVDDWEPAEESMYRGTWSVELPGAPATMGGRLVIEPDPDGSRYRLSGQVSVRIPLLGGRVEGFLADLVTKLVAREAEVVGRALGVAVTT